MKIKLLATGAIVDAEIVEMNCVRLLDYYYYQPGQYEVLPEEEVDTEKEEIRELIRSYRKTKIGEIMKPQQVVFVPFKTDTGWEVVSGVPQTSSGILHELESQQKMTSATLTESQAESLCIMAKKAVIRFCEINNLEIESWQ